MKLNFVLKSNLLVLIMLLMLTQLEAQQKSLKIINEKKISLSKENIVALAQLPDNSIVKIFSNEVRAQNTPGSLNRDLSTEKIQSGLILGSQNRISVPDDGEIIGVNDNVLYLRRSNIVTNKAQVVTYKINNNQLIKLKTLDIKLEESVFVLQNGNLVITDEYELFGNYFKIYTPSLDLLSTHNPYPNQGFKRLEFSDNGKMILFVVKNDDITKLIYVDSKNGKLLLEKSLTKELNIAKLEPSTNAFIATAYETGPVFFLVKIDLNGIVVWQKELLIPNNQFIVNDNADQIYAFTFDKIVAIDLFTSNTLWEQPLTDLYKKTPQTIDKNSVTIRVLDAALVTNANYLALIVGQSKTGSVTLKDSKYNCIGYILDSRGTVIDTIESIPASTKTLKIFSGDTSFAIVHDLAEMQYEIR